MARQRPRRFILAADPVRRAGRVGARSQNFLIRLANLRLARGEWRFPQSEEEWGDFYAELDSAVYALHNNIRSNFDPQHPILVTATAETVDGAQIQVENLRFDNQTNRHRSYRYLLNALLERLNSDESYIPQFHFHVSQVIPPPPQAPVNLRLGKKYSFRGSREEFARTKRGVIPILPSNDDVGEPNSCFLQWLVLGLASLQDVPLYTSCVRQRPTVKFRARRNAVDNFLLRYPQWRPLLTQDPIQSEELLSDIQAVLNIRLVLFDVTDRCRIVFPPPDALPYDELEDTVYGAIYASLEEPDQFTHVDLVTKPAALFGNSMNASGWCQRCFTAFYKSNKCTEVHEDDELCPLCHVCNGFCGCCLQKDCGEWEENLDACPACLVPARNAECQAAHVCRSERVARCPECHATVHAPHPCHTRKCKCGEWISLKAKDTHECFMARRPIKPASDKWAVYDFECYTNPRLIHVPYMVSFWAPLNPFGKPFVTSGGQVIEPGRPDHPFEDIRTRYVQNIVEDPRVEGPVFVFDRRMTRFFDFILERVWEGYTFFAHNARAYDAVLIKEALQARGLESEDIRRGCKFLQLYYKDIKLWFRDSLSFIPSALRDFTGAFHIEELTKGHYPHGLMTEAYIQEAHRNEGRMPRPKLEDFDIDFGVGEEALKETEEARAWITEWCAEAPEWDVFRTCRDYCISDTVLLGLGLLRFKEEVKHLTTVEGVEGQNFLDPLVYATLPSAIMSCYLAFHLPEKTIAVIDRGERQQSQVAEQWLYYNETQHGRELVREHRIGDFYVDGYDPQTNTVFEFYGCYWHGCPTHFEGRRFCARRQCTFRRLHQSTLAREQALRDQGYQVQSIWECEWRDLSTTDPVVKEWLELGRSIIEARAPLDPREAYRGGMVEVYALRYQGPLVMVDYVSQYPATTQGKTYEYLTASEQTFVEWPMPIGQPRISRLCSVAQFRASTGPGVAKVHILPPRQLFAPFLSMRAPSQVHPSEYEVLWPLCSKCAKERRFGYCDHLPRTRGWIGTWTLPELRHAESLGYQVDHVFEMWEYEGSINLFRAFMTPFIVSKVCSKAKGLVENGQLTEKGVEICAYLEELTGEPHDATAFENNPARRTVAKLMMNAFTGKWGQKEEHATKRVFGESHLDECARILADPEIEVTYVDVLSPQKVYVEYTPVHRSTTGHFEKNDHIVAHITAYGRIMLSRLVTALQDRVLYCDTDSAFHKAAAPGEPEVYRVGFRVGDLEPESQGREFVGIQRKGYAYVKRQGDQEIPVTRQKGIKLRQSNAAQFTPQALLDLHVHHCELLDANPTLLKRPAKEREMLYQEYEAQIVTEQRYFLTKETPDHKLYKQTAVRQKVTRRTGAKRWERYPADVAREDIGTLPFGYCENND